MYYGLPAR